MRKSLVFLCSAAAVLLCVAAGCRSPSPTGVVRTQSGTSNPWPGGGAATGGVSEAEVTNIVSAILATNVVVETDPVYTNYAATALTVNGFESRNDTTVSFDVGTRTLTLAPVGATFDYWYRGLIITGNTAKTSTIPDTEGLHVFYIDSTGALTNSQSATTRQLIIDETIVAYVYWDADNNTQIYVGEERHGINMASATHYHFHDSLGARYEEGITPGDFVIGSGALATHAQFSTTAGEIHDEDLSHEIDAKAVGDTWTVYYHDGASNWRVASNAYVGVKTGTVGEDRLAYNEFTGGAWQLTEVTGGDFVLAHIFANNDPVRQLVAIVGQAEYANLPAAHDGAATEVASLVTSGLPISEGVLVATIIFQTSDAYGNTMKARIVQNEDGNDFTDWRFATITAGSAPGDHGNLTGLADDDHTQYYNATRLNSYRPWTTNVVDISLANGTSADFAITNIDQAIPLWGPVEAFLTATGGFPIAVNSQWKFYRADARTDSLEFVSDTDVQLVEIELSVAPAAGTNIIYVADASDFETNQYVNVHDITMVTNETHLVTSVGDTNIVLSGTLTYAYTTDDTVSKVLRFDMPMFPIASSNSLLGSVEYTDPSTNQFDLRFEVEYR